MQLPGTQPVILGRLVFVAGMVLSGDIVWAQAPVLLIPPSAGTHCVEPTPIMRREHMKFLLQQRDKTVHEGERDSQHSLTGCVNCHTNQDAAGRQLPVNQEGQFCAVCHQSVGVTMDCFSCHRATPDA